MPQRVLGAAIFAVRLALGGAGRIARDRAFPGPDDVAAPLGGLGRHGQSERKDSRRSHQDRAHETSIFGAGSLPVSRSATRRRADRPAAFSRMRRAPPTRRLPGLDCRSRRGGGRLMASEQLPSVLQPEEGASYWRPRPTNGYVTVKASPALGGPAGIAMGIQ